MGPLWHRMLRPQVWLALWISLALILSPVAVDAAPAASSLAQTAYADPDGRFSLTVPDAFTEQADVTYEMLGDNPLDKLVASAGRAFAEPDTPNGVSVLFLVLDDAIEDREEFAGFLAAFQTAAGGETLPLVDLNFVDGERLAATGSAATRDRQLQIAVEAQDSVVAVLTTRVERARFRDLRSALDETLASFTWNPDAVLALLGEAPPPPDEPEAEPEAEPTPEPEAEPTPEPEAEPTPEPETEPETEAAPADDTPQLDADAVLETERYTDPEGVFTIEAPAGLQASDLTDAEQVVYGMGFYGPDDVDSDIPALAVAFGPASFAATGSVGAPDFAELDDERWNQFVDMFVVNDVEGMTVVTDQRNDALRTAFLVLEEDEPGVETPQEMWVWVEESDGMGALFIVVGDVDDPVNGEIFHSALTSFAWSPSAAASATAELAGVFDPAQAPVPFDDPFGLITAYTPPDYPFQAAYSEADTLEYRFGRNPTDGVFQISLSSPAESAYNPSSWGILVDEVQASVLQTLSDGSLGANARLVQQEAGVPDVGADNAATILARTDAYWMLVTLLDRDGVLMSEVVILPDSYWQEHSAVAEDAVARGVDFDPDAVRDAIDLSQELGVAVVDTGAADAMPARGEEIDWRSSFDVDDPITVAVDFAQPGMEGALKAIVFADDLPDYPLVQFAQWLGEEDAASYGKMTSQEETGTRAAFSFIPDFPLNPGEYTAYFYYDNELVAANGFTVEDSPPSAPDIANFGPAYGDAAAGEPLLITTAIHPGDVVSLRGQVDMPAGSQLRLFWYDPEGWVDTGEVATIRFDNSFRIPYDWVYFEPQIAWQPGVYSYRLTVDGVPFYEGELFVIGESAEIELTSDGAELLAALPLPPEMILDPSPDEVDLALLPTEDYSSVDLISDIDAWLRMQGWEPALPPVSSPVAWDYRRWVKDGYQFVLEPGGFAAEDQIWMNYAPVTDTTWGPLPAGEALDAVNVDALGEAAALEIEGLDASQAVVSPDGNWLAVTTTDGTLYLFDATRLMDTIWWRADAFYANPVFSPDSRNLAATVQAQSRSEIQLFSNFDVIWLPTTRLNGHTDQVTAIDYQPDGWLASGGLDGAVRQWEPAGAFLPVLVDGEGAVTGLAAAPEAAPGVIVGREGGWLEYRLDDGDVPWADAVALTESPRVAVWSGFTEAGSGDLAVYGEGQVEWHLYDTAEIGLGLDVPEENPDFASTGAAFSPNGALLVISGDTIHFYDRMGDIWLSEWEVVSNGERTPVSGLSVSPDGRYVVIVAEDGSVRLWAATMQ